MFSYIGAQSVPHENIQPFIAVVTSKVSAIGSFQRSQAPSNLLKLIYERSSCHLDIVATAQHLCTSLFAGIGWSARLLGESISSNIHCRLLFSLLFFRTGGTIHSQEQVNRPLFWICVANSVSVSVRICISGKPSALFVQIEINLDKVSVRMLLVSHIFKQS